MRLAAGARRIEHFWKELFIMPIESLVILVLMFALMYFFMIRPENKRKKEAENLRNSLVVGDDVTTIGGITGTICAVKESTVVIETGADRVRIELAKWAISSKNAKAEAQK